MAELVSALAGDPDILLLDEVLANLDSSVVVQLVAMLERWRTDRLVILTSHQALPLQADRVIELA